MQATKLHILTCLAALLLPLVQLSSQNKAQWELKRKSGGVEVYVREAVDSPFKELKFTGSVEASLSAITAVLTDADSYDEWVYRSLRSETIKWTADEELYYYSVTDFPWPFDDRDMIGKTKTWQNPKTLAIHSKTTSAHWLKPEVEDMVRLKKAEMEWVFTPVGNGKVRFEFYMKADPGGSLPAWLVNLAADQGPLQTIAKFKVALKEEKYRNTKLAFVQEKK